MNHYVLYTKPKEREIYYTGSGICFPEFTGSLQLAAQFPTARAAYDHAHAHQTMQMFRVGRRPSPFNLRGFNR